MLTCLFKMIPHMNFSYLPAFGKLTFLSFHFMINTSICYRYIYTYILFHWYRHRTYFKIAVFVDPFFGSDMFIWQWTICMFRAGV